MKDQNPRIFKRVARRVKICILDNNVEIDIKRKCYIYEQSSIEESKQVLSYFDTVPGDSLAIGGSVPDGRQFERDAELGEFWARPVIIAPYRWDTTFFAQELDPWNALFNNKRISNRLSNYNLFKGKCKIKIVVNGGPFYYGRLMVAYLPYADKDLTTAKDPSVPLNRLIMSQCPHVFIDPTTDHSVEMELPFFFHSDYVRLIDTDVDRQLGKLYFYQMSPLRHANTDLAATGASISLSVYAYFEGVEVHGPTARNIYGISQQSKREKEDVSKPISQPATAIASAAKVLSRVPIISPYATAIETAATMTATIASALGYCRPTDCVEPGRLQPRMVGNLGVTNTTDSCMTMALDVKQALSIDPRICGLDGIDELAITNLTTKESFITSFPWTENENPEAMIGTVLVTPYLNTLVAGTTYPSAMAGVASLFQYWTGTIKFKLQVVCSAYHRGRLAIVYDPNVPLLGQVREDNIAYTEIVDISENREFEISISNFQPFHWFRRIPGWEAVTKYSTNPILTSQEYANGVLSIYVLNELTVPNSDASVDTSVDILLYAYTGDDFEVANPSPDIRRNTIAISEQSSIDDPAEVDEVQHAQHTPSVKESSHLVYIGEKVTSLRTLLRRYNGYMRYLYQYSDTNENSLQVSHQMFPLRKGAGQGTPYTGLNGVSTTLLSLLSTAFCAWRGQVRWKIVYLGPPSTIYGCRITGTLSSAAYRVTNQNITTGTQDMQDFEEIEAFGCYGGSTITTDHMNPSIELELPFYSNYKFCAGKVSDLLDSPSAAVRQHFTISARELTTESVASKQLSFFVAGGEDMSFMYFSGFQPYTDRKSVV